MQSYIVVGGGLAGLTAANALAEAGGKVTVLEQSEHAGGRAITQRQDGFLLNLGPHALYRNGLATRTFQEWNIPFQGHPPANEGGYLVHEGRKYPLISDAMSLFKSPLFRLTEKIEAANLLRRFAAGRAPLQRMQVWIDDHARSQKVRGLAAAITRVTTFAADMEHLSAPAALAQIGLALAGNVAYLDHGWQTLIDGLVSRARSLGVQIRCGAAVNSLAELDASGVILAVPPASVEKMAGLGFLNLRPIRVACLDMGLDSLPEKAANFGLGVDRPLYYSVHSKVAQLAPEGGSALIHFAKYLEGDSDPAADRAEMEQLADVLAPCWRDRVSMMRFLPNMTVSHAMVTPEGRPDVDALHKEGVALAGDWVGPENMLADAAVSSALRAARMVQRSHRAAA